MNKEELKLLVRKLSKNLASVTAYVLISFGLIAGGLIFPPLAVLGIIGVAVYLTVRKELEEEDEEEERLLEAWK